MQRLQPREKLSRYGWMIVSLRLSTVPWISSAPRPPLAQWADDATLDVTPLQPLIAGRPDRRPAEVFAATRADVGSRRRGSRRRGARHRSRHLQGPQPGPGLGVRPPWGPAALTAAAGRVGHCHDRGQALTAVESDLTRQAAERAELASG